MKSVTRRLALRRTDLDDAVCPVPEEFVGALGDRTVVTVVFEHRVHGIRPTRQAFEAAPRQEVGWQFDGISWPADVHPGVLVTIAWKPAKEEVLIRTVALDEPMRVDGVDYFHEYDPQVVTREFAPDKSNRGQVLQTVRRLGRVFEDGSAVFPESELAAHCGLGRGSRGTFLLRNAVDQLIREGFVTRVAGSVGADGRPCYPAADGEETTDMLFYAPLVEPSAHPDDPYAADGEGSERREHWVNGFLRRLPPGAKASERQLTLHQRTVEHDEDEESSLPPGYTFVKKHHRSG